MRLLVLTSLLAGLAHAQEPGTATVEKPANRHTNRSGMFSLVLPPRWRQVTPDEARKLRQGGATGFSRDLLDPKPAEFYAYGDVDRWLAENRFDGRCLSVIISDGEPEEGDEALASIRQFAASYTEGRYEILDAEWTEIGPDAHPTIRCRSRREIPGDTQPIRLLELFAPSGGRTIVLAYRAFDDDFDAAEPEFARSVATVRFSREPRGQRDLSGDIIYIAVIGAIVGLLLAVMRKRNAP